MKTRKESAMGELTEDLKKKNQRLAFSLENDFNPDAKTSPRSYM